MIRKIFTISIYLTFLIPAIVYAGSGNKLLTISRYQTVQEKPTTAQVHLLSQAIQMRFPQNIQTIGAAMNYVLHYSGYRLVPTVQMNRDFSNTFAMPLPAVDRDFGPMSLRDALVTLAGPAFYLVEDQLHRTVNFKVKPAFIHADVKVKLNRERI